MTRRFGVIAVGLVGVVLGGCSTLDKLNPFKSEPKIKPAELKPIQGAAELPVRWQVTVGEADDFVLTPAVVGDSVYAAARDGTVARIDNGRQSWRIAAGEKLAGGVGADRDLVVVGTEKGQVMAFDAESGKPRWTARVSSEVLAPPLVNGDQVVVRSVDARVVGLDRADGKRRWVYQRVTPALTLRSNVGMTMVDNTVLAGFPGGKLVAINGKNGAAMWEATVAVPKGATELERVADITSLPVADERQVCAVAYQGRVACFELANGNQVWGRDISSSAGLDMDQTRVYVSDDTGAVQAFARDGGASLWKQDKLANRGLSRPIMLGRRVAVADFQGFVHFLDVDDGAFVARAATDGSAIRANPQRVAGGLVVQTRKGSVIALGVQ
ncbi:MAG: outer membrane protein assembly factor BamB [Rhodocyclaceae bacterium]|nr:outer membrane protein assembly factor BamB [Rhodocyclaceae bacterium]MBK9311155.1 outer membrane protein assembly factor BamB [Rhodocyclaceae bacterium]